MGELYTKNHYMSTPNSATSVESEPGSNGNDGVLQCSRTVASSPDGLVSLWGFE